MRHPIAIAGLAGVVLAGCATQQQTDTAVGAGIGAVAGAVLGRAVSDNKGRGTNIGAATGAAIGGAVGYNWQAIKEKLTGDTRGTGVDVAQQPDGSLKLNVPGSVSFATDSTAIRPEFRPTLDRIAETLNQHPETYVRVVGHTDSVGAESYNQQLSERRATSVASYLSSRGVSGTRMAAQGAGEMQPIASNDNETGRAQNRRVEMYIEAPQQAAPPPR